MKLRPLPADVQSLLAREGVPPRLWAHLTLVHDTAAQLVEAVRAYRPDLTADWEAVLFGAATHDLGKCRCPEELVAPGRRHETLGEALLREQGIAPHRARFARTHGTIDPEGPLEDLLVSLADRIWKGKRDEDLEAAVCRKIGGTDTVSWEVYLWLDDLLTRIAAGADARLAWHQSQSVTA